MCPGLRTLADKKDSARRRSRRAPRRELWRGYERAEPNDFSSGAPGWRYAIIRTIKSFAAIKIYLKLYKWTSSSKRHNVYDCIGQWIVCATYCPRPRRCCKLRHREEIRLALPESQHRAAN